MTKMPIKIWPWNDAPKKYRNLSKHCGDEDWVALVPSYFADMYIPWLEVGLFGVCDVSKHILRDGKAIYIGAHA